MTNQRRRIEDAGTAKSRPSFAGRLPSLLLVLCPLPIHAHAQSDSDSEYRVKLAFLYSFAQFVQWPPEAFAGPGAPLNLCVLRTDPFQGEIEQSLRGRTANGHPVEIRKLKATDDLKACHLIFSRAGEKAAARKILAGLKGSDTLAIGEAKGFTDMGGMINFTLEENKLRFEINIDAATQTRLKINSKLLALAKIVKATPPP